MRRYIIGGIGLMVVALFLVVPTATAEAHSPHGGHVAHAARHAGYRVHRGYRGVRHIRHARKSLRIVPPNARYPYWHYNTRLYRR